MIILFFYYITREYINIYIFKERETFESSGCFVLFLQFTPSSYVSARTLPYTERSVVAYRNFRLPDGLLILNAAARGRGAPFPTVRIVKNGAAFSSGTMPSTRRSPRGDVTNNGNRYAKIIRNKK